MAQLVTFLLSNCAPSAGAQRLWWRGLAVALVGLTCCATAHAQLYKCLDEKGRKIFSNSPCAVENQPESKPDTSHVIPRKQAAAPAQVAQQPPVQLTEALVVSVEQGMEAANNDLDASAFCAYLGPDFTFYAADSSGGANATRSGGRADFCNFVKSGFQMMRQGGVKQSVKSGPYKVVISADKTTAVVTYESVVSISVSGAGTVSSRCQSEDTMGSYAGQVVVLRSTGQCSTK